MLGTLQRRFSFHLREKANVLLRSSSVGLFKMCKRATVLGRWCVRRKREDGDGHLFGCLTLVAPLACGGHRETVHLFVNFMNTSAFIKVAHAQALEAAHKDFFFDVSSKH